MLYMAKFFKTFDEAKAFKKRNGCWVLYRLDAPAKNGRIENNYMVEAVMRGMTEEQMKALPYCVAWNQL